MDASMENRLPAKTSGKPVRQHNPEATQRNIIDVAMIEFARNGLSGARIDEIAEKTKTSKRMIYYYFGDKEGLYLRCLEEAYMVVRAGEGQLSLSHLTPVDALRQLVEFTFDHHAGHKDFIRLVMIENIHHAEYLTKSKTIREFNRTAIDNLEEVYRRGVASEAFRGGIEPIDLHWHISALCFFNISNSATFSKIFDVDVLSDAAQAKRRQQVVDMILRFVAP
jgi:AcrR family transcriptional regulator